MDIQIKNYADSKNLKELKYIFVDALDVDPTFVRYEEEYNYCKSIPGLLEPHKDLTPFTQDRRLWNEDYWTCLKMDLIDNFSDRRMMHMKEVAQVFLAEKVERILNERHSTEPALAAPVTPPPVNKTISEPVPTYTPVSKVDAISGKEKQNRELEAEKRRNAEKYGKDIEAEKADAERIKRQQSMNYSSTQYRKPGDLSKKAIGIAVAALAVVAIVLILILK